MVKKITKTEIIAQYLNDYGKRYYLRELANILNKPHQTIKPYLQDLVKEKILLKFERKNFVEYGLNMKNSQIYDHLVITEKEKLMKRLQEDTYLRVFFEKLTPFFQQNTFILFGSAVNKIQKGSDIDIVNIWKKDAKKGIQEFEQVYNKKIHEISVPSIKKISPRLIKEIYKKHLILNNTEEVIRYFGELYEKNQLV